MHIKKLKEPLSRKLKVDYSKFFLPVAALWFAIRVIPKPSRISYPCQRAALGLVSVKLGIVLSTLVTSTTSLTNRKSVKVFSVAVLVGVILWDPLTLAYYQYNYANSNAKLLTLNDTVYNFPNQRIVRLHSATATDWDFNSAVSQYWEHVNQTAVDLMVERGVMELTDASDAVSAWNLILLGYVSGQTVGIKINGNDWWNADDREIDSLPHITNGIIKGLKSIGVPESDIHIIENTHTQLGYRTIRPYYTNTVKALYPNVVFQYSTNTSPTYGNVAGTTVTFPYGSTRINDQIASVDHLILVPIMKAITPMWGVTGSIKLMQGVIDLSGSTFHNEIGRTTADNPHVLVYQNQHIVGKTRLIVGDGVFGAWTGQHFTGGYGGTDYLNSPVNDIPKPWITFDNGAPNCLFFGVDPVAIDSVMYDHILRERNAQDQVSGQTLAPFSDPQLQAGAAAGIGIREHGPPYTNIDYHEVELDEAPAQVRDIAVTNIALSPATVVKGGIVDLNVTVANYGDTDESFNVTLYYDHNIIETRTNVYLTAGTMQILLFTWDTTGVADGIYTIKAESSSLLGETNVTNNSYVDGTVAVSSAPVHDVAVIDVSASPTTVLPGQMVDITVLAENQGTESETFTITTHANATLIDSRIVALTPLSTTTEIFTWNTTGALGVYLIWANASVVGDEVDTADNTLQFDGAVAVFTHPVAFPAASFVYLPAAPLASEEITFNASSSSDPDGTIVSYQWNFGDGAQENGSIATHRYLNHGNYTVTLTVVDNDGLFDKDRKFLLVREHPQASFTFSPTSPLVGEVVTFNAGASIPRGGSIVSYKWDFGDGEQVTESDSIVAHTFSAKGEYTVTLTVTDDEELSDTAVLQMAVNEKTTQPLLTTEFVLFLVIGAIIVGIGLTALFLRRRS